MICWYCFWGWPVQVADIYEEAVRELGDDLIEFGPGHVVFSDENFDDGNIQFCINACADPMYHDCDPQDLLKLKGYLQRLLEIPEDVRCCVPDNYDEVHPEKFPPTIPVRKIK